MAAGDCHGTWKYWPASGPVSFSGERGKEFNFGSPPFKEGRLNV